MMLAAWIVLGWCVLSVPSALLVGRFLKVGKGN